MTEDQPDILDTAQAAHASSDQGEAASRRNIANLLWEANQGAPPLREDPIAAMLGLVPDPSYALDSGKLKQARKRAGLQISDLVARLATRGWTVDKADLFRWENQSTSDVAPALIKALAEETGNGPDQLVTQQPRAVPAAITRALQSPRFAGIVERWARVQNVSQGLATSELESRMLAMVYRGDEADADQMMAALEALVSTTEDAEEPYREP